MYMTVFIPTVCQRGQEEARKRASEGLTIVTTDKRIAVLVLLVSVDVLGRLLECDVHVSIETAEYSC